jgi:hypothetical protein
MREMTRILCYKLIYIWAFFTFLSSSFVYEVSCGMWAPNPLKIKNGGKVNLDLFLSFIFRCTKRRYLARG